MPASYALAANLSKARACGMGGAMAQVRIRLGSQGSPLALAQAEMARAALLDSRIGAAVPPDVVPPAPAQAAVGPEMRADDVTTRHLIARPPEAVQRLFAA